MLDVLKKKSLLLIMAYSPAGLGHLRVLEALYHGLPKDVTPHLLGSDEKSISILHRISSIHPLARSVMEWAQNGTQEDLFTKIHLKYLLYQTKTLHKKLLTILDQRIEPADTVLIVATHFGLAHQLALIKEPIENERHVKIFLAVQVTDDSPQHIWFTPGADLIFVPSQKTKDELIKYGKEKRERELNFIVSPYPVSRFLTGQLTIGKMQNRINQTEFNHKSLIHVAVPVSGAAVGTSYSLSLIDRLSKKSPRFIFHLICKVSPYTKSFLEEVVKRPNVKLHVALTDRAVVEKYEQVYLDNVISLEITKPSEQAFKALIDPGKTGGAILLFSHPVGRQEYDNLNFLRRHNLIPSVLKQKELIKREIKKSVIKADNWRGLILPDDPAEAADFINWSVENNLLTSMLKCSVAKRANGKCINELSDQGVRIFWEEICKYLLGYLR